MPILKGAGNTLLCSCVGYGKWISTRAKGANSETPHPCGPLIGRKIRAPLSPVAQSTFVASPAHRAL